MAGPTTDTVKYEKRDRVAWIHLNRPAAMNALNPQISVSIRDAIANATEDDDILVGHMPTERPYQNGLVQVLVEDRDELIAEAEKLAGEIKLCAPLAIRAIKETLRTKRNMPAAQPSVTQLAQLAREVKERKNVSEDRIEGPKAFAEKRAPNGRNR